MLKRTRKNHRFRKYPYKWRRFSRGKRKFVVSGSWRDQKLDKQFTSSPILVDYVCQSTDFFDCAEERVVSLMQRRPEVYDLDRYIDKLRKKFEKSKDGLDGVTALLAQAPRASLAQIQMEKFPGGYRNKKERLYELIDFNDTLMESILVLDEFRRDQFKYRVKQAMDRVCQRVGAPEFTDEQWTAIIRGLTREIAVYTAAIETGFNAWLTDRAHDALGIDIQIQDPETKRYVNIDVKTPSSFRHRMENLIHEGRLTEQELLLGDERSYIIEHNGPKNRKTEIIVLCIQPERFGALVDWKFVDTTAMREMLNFLIRENGLSDGKYGELLMPNRGF